MALDNNPFVVLSYVSGPALLTNATSLLLLSTTNRFARAIDRSRLLTAQMLRGSAERDAAADPGELRIVGKRIRLIGLSIAGFYLAAAMFALATVTSILGAVLASWVAGTAFDLIVAFAVLLGGIGFAAFVTGAFSLVAETRLTMGSLARESAAAIAAMERSTRG